MPDGIFKLTWDTFIMLLLLINIFYIPIKIAFQGGDENNKDNETLIIADWIRIVLDDIPQWAFLIDIFMNFNTAVYYKGFLIKNRKKIAELYFKGRFFWDFVVITPYIISQYFSIPYIDTILLLRQKKIRLIIKSYEEILNLRDQKKAIYDLCKLIVVILFVGHFTGCLFYFLAQIEIQHKAENTWLHYYELTDKGWFQQYTAALYWAVITMITVGYGDISPQNMYEQLFVIGITLISCGVFAYSVNSIGVIVGQMTERDTEFSSKMSLITIYMRQKDLDQELQMRVKNYFEYLHNENIQQNLKAESILGGLCDSLKSEVYNNIYYKELIKRELFRFNFSDGFLYKLSTCLEEVYYGPEEIIMEQNVENDVLHFILKGSCYLYTQIGKSQKTMNINKIGVGFNFGEYSFFTGDKSQYGAKTIGVVSILAVKRNKFIQISQDYPQDYEKFCYIRDQICQKCDIYNYNYMQCCSCKSFRHTFSNCRFLNYIPYEEKILFQYQQENKVNQKRYKRFKRKLKKNKSKLNLNIIKQKTYYFLVDHSDPQEFEQLLKNFELLEGQMPDKKLNFINSNQKSKKSTYIQDIVGLQKQQIEREKQQLKNQIVQKSKKQSPYQMKRDKITNIRKSFIQEKTYLNKKQSQSSDDQGIILQNINLDEYRKQELQQQFEKNIQHNTKNDNNNNLNNINNQNNNNNLNNNINQDKDINIQSKIKSINYNDITNITIKDKNQNSQQDQNLDLQKIQSDTNTNNSDTGEFSMVSIKNQSQVSTNLQAVQEYMQKRQSVLTSMESKTNMLISQQSSINNQIVNNQEKRSSQASLKLKRKYQNRKSNLYQNQNLLSDQLEQMDQKLTRAIEALNTRVFTKDVQEDSKGQQEKKQQNLNIFQNLVHQVNDSDPLYFTFNQQKFDKTWLNVDKFDILRDFKTYFPENNYNEVIKNYSQVYQNTLVKKNVFQQKSSQVLIEHNKRQEFKNKIRDKDKQKTSQYGTTVQPTKQSLFADSNQLHPLQTSNQNI